MSIERFKLPMAVHLFLIQDKQVLLHLRKNSSFEGQYSVVAGHLDGEETATAALIREAQEEAGIKIEPADLKIATVSHSHANNKEVMQLFLFCEKWQGDIINLEPEKCSALQFFPIDDLPENTVAYVKKAIECALSNITYFEFGWDEK